MPVSIRAIPAFPPNLVKRNQGDCFVSEDVKQDLMLLGSNRKQLADEAAPDSEPGELDAQAPREKPVFKTLLEIFSSFFGSVPVNDR